jgi:hypothetical protein
MNIPLPLDGGEEYPTYNKKKEG